MAVNQDAMQAISDNEILTLVTGQTIASATENLVKKFDSVEMNVQPGFIKRMPLLAFRIKVDIDENGL